MSERAERLVEVARAAAERAVRERREAAAAGAAPHPGDLYALPATAEHAVEWLVVAAADGDRWLLLPADLAGTGGGADVEVPANEPGGPLTVYARFPVTVPATLLPPSLRTGRLAEGRRAEAERRWRGLAAGTEPAELEADFDPDYRRRLVELAAARQALEAAVAAAEGGDPGGGPGGGPGPGGPRPAGHETEAEAPQPVPFVRPAPRRHRPPPWMTALAAVLALAVVGLTTWNVSLQRQVERATRLSMWQLDPVPPQVVVDDPTRSAEVVLPPYATNLSLAWRQPPEAGVRYRARLLDRDGQQIEEMPIVTGADEVELGLSGTALHPGARLTLVVDRFETDRWEREAEVPVRVEDD